MSFRFGIIALIFSFRVFLFGSLSRLCGPGGGGIPVNWIVCFGAGLFSFAVDAASSMVDDNDVMFVVVVFVGVAAGFDVVALVFC